MSEKLTFCNPFWPKAFPDPFVLKVRGRYYAYATEPEMHPYKGSKVFPILTSSDLVHWNELESALPAFGAPYNRYWAPEVTTYNGQFFLYYAVHTEEFQGSIRVAVSDSPEGPFTDSGRDLTAAYLPWAIDPHVFRDQDGQWYLYMTIDYWNDPITGFTGSGNAVVRLLDPFTLQGNITRVTAPSHSWELFEAKRQEKGGLDWYTVEGPSVMCHRKRYYEMFSGGCYYRDNYAMSYATSDMPLGPDGMRDTSWRGWEGAEEQPFLIYGDGEHLISPGHNSVVLGPNNVDQYLIYHALQKDMLERHPCIDRLFWHGENMWTPAPTHTPQLAPAMPRIRELFGGEMLSALWQPQDGNWYIANNAVIQGDATLSQAILHRQESLNENWVLEINLRPLTENGSFGVMLHNENQSALHVLLTSDADLLVKSSGSQADPLHQLSLPEGTIVQAWHQLLLSCSGSILSIQFDGLSLLEVLLENPISTFSLLAEFCQVAFSGISLTDHYRDEFLDNRYTPALLGWRNGSERQAEAGVENTLADWRIHDGMLEQTSIEQGVHILIKGSSSQWYEFGVTLRLQPGNEHKEARFGCILWHNETEKIFIWLSQGSATWQFVVESTTDISSDIGTSLDLPGTFKPLDWHTFRFVRQSDQLSIYLDGIQVVTLPMQTRMEMVGLVTYHANALFTSVWQTG